MSTIAPISFNSTVKYFQRNFQFYYLMMTDAFGMRTPKMASTSLAKTTTNSQQGPSAPIQQSLAFAKKNQQFNPEISLTQKQILSHQIIRQIVSKSKSKTIKHQVNQIPKNIQLFKVPLEPITNQFTLNPQDHQKPTDELLSSQTQIIKQLHNRLSQEKDITQRIEQIALNNITKCSLMKQNLRKASEQKNMNKRVSISGLVSYSFNSVKARRSLGSIPDIPEQQALQKKIDQVKRRNSCSVHRQNKILDRRGSSINKHRKQLAKAAISNFSLPTQTYLKLLEQEKNKKKHIYGEPMQKLQCIKQLMQKQGTDYDHAEFVISALSNLKKKQKKEKVREKFIIDDELQLSKRRRAVSGKRVMAKHLYFID